LVLLYLPAKWLPQVVVKRKTKEDKNYGKISKTAGRPA
jgi:hypothetical protein